MRLTPDSNILIRAVVKDDTAQSRAAGRRLDEATHIALSTHVLCEFVWVLTRTYKFKRAEIASSIRNLLAAANVHADTPTVHAGLAFLDAGADFADGVIAFQGRMLGGEVFMSFDRNALRAAASLGFEIMEP